MSWEDNRSEDKPCPCGKSHFTVTFRSNDWGQHEEQWSMYCPECARTHGLYSYIVSHKGLSDTRYIWLPKRQLRELKELEALIGELKDALAAHLRFRYAAHWTQYFMGKPKKEIWAEVTDNGSRYPQLSTFYSHVRQVGLESALNGYLQYDKVSIVTHILHLDDADLASRVVRIRDLESSLAAKNDAIRAEGVHRQ